MTMTTLISDEETAEIMKKIAADGNYIQNIESPTEEMKLAAVLQNGYVLKHIKSPSKSVQNAAVRSQPRAIMYVENPSETLQRIAVKKDGAAVNAIKNPSSKIIVEALKKSPRYAAMWAPKIHRNDQHLLIQKHPELIKYLKKPAPSAQMAFIKANKANTDEQVNNAGVNGGWAGSGGQMSILMAGGGGLSSFSSGSNRNTPTHSYGLSQLKNPARVVWRWLFDENPNNVLLFEKFTQQMLDYVINEPDLKREAGHHLFKNCRNAKHRMYLILKFGKDIDKPHEVDF